jgi:transglutaminase-like putative cysteine protease
MAGRSAPALGVHLAVVSALTTWLTLFAWGGFVASPGSYLNPLVGALALVVAVGVLSRWARLTPLLVLGTQLLMVLFYANVAWGSSLLPTLDSLRAMWATLESAITAAREYAAPVPDNAPSVAPLLISGGMLCGLLVDFFAVTLRRVPVAGLPLLMIYSLPVSALDRSVNWLVFCLSALGFLAMLSLQERDRIGRWGRTLSVDESDALGFGSGTNNRHTLAIGASATALAVFLPVLIPTLDLHVLGGGAGGLGGGNDRDVRITNPMTDLRRDLVLGEDRPLMRVRTTQPNPEYLHISLLTVFTGLAWTPGGRDLPARQAADGAFPEPNGMDDTVPRTTVDWDVEIMGNFRSLWLPTPEYVDSMDAGEDWRYDGETLDVSAARRGIDSAGKTYSASSLVPQFSAQAMADAGAPPVDIAAPYTELPDEFPQSVRDLATQVTAGQPTDYQKAVALQQFFRRDGKFRYTTEPPPGNGVQDLVSFLDKDAGREGYCEQFATAMAAMARSLDIPARVVVGFLSGEQVTPDVWEYSTRDLHAWPELYFEGSGWVKFEPTPSGRAPAVPSYTTDRLTQESNDALPSTNSSVTNRASNAPKPTESADASAAANGNDGRGGGVPWTPVLWTLGVLVLLVALLLAPRFLRQAATTRRWRTDGDPAEAAWAELRATATDLGVAWPAGRSPRAAASLLQRSFGAPLGPDTPARPGTGARTNPEAVAALGQIVRAVEESRYSPAPSYTPGIEELRSLVSTCISALEGGATSQARLRATWLPASVLTLRRGSTQRPTVTRVRSTQDVVDHVG